MSERRGVTDGPGRSRRLVFASVIIAAVPVIEVTALGGNSAFLGALAAVLQLVMSLSILVLLRPEARMWAGVLPVVLVLLAGFLWAALPDLAMRLAPNAALPWGPVQRPATDLLVSAACRYFATVATLLSGVMIGYRRGLMHDVVDWIVWLGTVNIVTGFVLREIDPLHVWGLEKNIHKYRFTGTLQNANAAACVFGVLALLAVARLWISSDAVRSVRGPGPPTVLLVNFVAAVGAFGSCLITGSRSALMLTGLGIAWLAVTAYRDRNNTGAGKWITPVGIGAVGLALLALFGELTLGRMGQVSTGSENRVLIWAHYWRIAVAQPIYGYGLGAFTQVNLHYLTSHQDAADFAYINAAHNQAIQLILAGGMPFLASQVVAVALIALSIAGSRRGGRHDPVFSAIWLSLVMILACSLVDIALTVPAILTLAATLLGLLWGRALRSRAISERYDLRSND